MDNSAFMLAVQQCLQTPEPQALSVLFGLMTAFNLSLAFGFLFHQLIKKGKDALTRFTLLAVLLPVGLGISTLGTALTSPTLICMGPPDAGGLAIEGLGIAAGHVGYLSFLYTRSSALVNGRFKRAFLVFMVIVTNMFMIAWAISAALFFQYFQPDMYTATFALGPTSGLLTLLTDLTFLAFFIKHLRYMKLNVNNWFVISDDDDSLRVIAKVGLRCCLTLFVALILNVASFGLVPSTFGYYLEYFFKMSMLSTLAALIIYMKYTVDGVQSRESSKHQQSSSVGSYVIQKKSTTSEESGNGMASV